MLYGSKADARKEYFIAASQRNGLHTEAFIPVGACENISLNSPLYILRVDAYFNSGIYYCNLKDVAGLAISFDALSLEPKSPLMRFGYGRLDKDPSAQLWTAEHEATRSLKAAIHKYRAQDNTLYGANVGYIVNGVNHQTVYPYKLPKRPVYTPKLTDQLLAGNPRWEEDSVPVASAP